jgi:hypothetical protein
MSATATTTAHKHKRKRATRTAAPQWVSVMSIDVGERALAMWFGRLNVQNPVEGFETLDWWAQDTYPEGLTKGSVPTSVRHQFEFLFRRRHKLPTPDCIVVEQQVQINKRMVNMATALHTNLFHLFPALRNRIANVSSNNKVNLMRKLQPDVLPPKEEMKKMNFQKCKRLRKKAAIAVARSLDPGIDGVDAAKLDDLADTLLQALASTTCIKRLVRQPLVPAGPEDTLISGCGCDDGGDGDGPERKKTRPSCAAVSPRTAV